MAVQNVQVWSGANQDSSLIMTNALVYLIQFVLKISAGMARHVIHGIIATVLNVLMYKNALQDISLILKLAIVRL